MPAMRIPFILLTAACWITRADAEPRFVIDATGPGRPVSPYLTGSCLEDVNHEVYGGIDSQLVFGESFAEPAPEPVPEGFAAFGGRWTVSDGELHAAGGDGPKLARVRPALTKGEIAVDLYFPDGQAGNAGLIVHLSNPKTGADAFTGYEVSLDTTGKLVLGRHRGNWEPIREVPCAVPTGKWIRLAVSVADGGFNVAVDGNKVAGYEDKENPLKPGGFALRTWKRDARFRDLTVISEGVATKLPFAPGKPIDRISGMWRAVRKGSAAGSFAHDLSGPVVGAGCQTIRFTGGEGELGIGNQGLNRWGINIVAGKPYEGRVVVRAEKPTTFAVALESRDGSAVLAEQQLTTPGEGGWSTLDFRLLPSAGDPRGRFSVILREPSSLDVNYVLLQPGDWGRFNGLPVRRDIAEGLMAQKVPMLRYGGCMANAPGYRWKNMIGPRETRPPYQGWWYPQSSNGWGIFEFLGMCEAMGIPGIPTIQMDEAPADMMGFIEYAKGEASSPWGARRVANGHPKPYPLKHLQLGNEERVDEAYWRKFKPMAEAIWSRDRDIILVVGDFAYQRKISDPFSFEGADSKITSLEAHRKILQLAKQHGREVWFDVHVWTGGPLPSSYLDGALSYLDMLTRIADGAKFRVVVFELNADNHDQRRALANALAIQRFERDGRVPVVLSANCLQPDGQNDNGWNQGLLFFNPDHVWMQSPGHVARMFAAAYQPLGLPVKPSGGGNLDVCAKRSKDGKTLVVQVVNPGEREETAELEPKGFRMTRPNADVEELAGPLSSTNLAAAPNQMEPKRSEWPHAIRNGVIRRAFPPYSVTVMTFR